MIVQCSTALESIPIRPHNAAVMGHALDPTFVSAISDMATPSVKNTSAMDCWPVIRQCVPVMVVVKESISVSVNLVGLDLIVRHSIALH